MRRKFALGFALSLVAMVLFNLPAAAGGWATVDQISVSDSPRAGGTTTIDFRLQQHGVTPIDWTTTFLTATNEATGESLRADAKPLAETGRWTVDVTFPSEGAWNWEIQTDELQVTESTFEPLNVAAADGATASVVTSTELDSALASTSTSLRAEFSKQIAGIGAEQEALSKQLKGVDGAATAKRLSNLELQMQKLDKQIGSMNASPATTSNESTIPWWGVAIGTALTTVILVCAVLAVLLRRGILDLRHEPGDYGQASPALQR